MKHYYCWTLPHYINSLAVYQCLACYPIGNERHYIFKSSPAKSANGVVATCASAVIRVLDRSKDGSSRQTFIRTYNRSK
jgi:hypothetical protein